MSCPRCQRESTTDVDLYFGYRQVLDYELGDECEWWPEEATVFSRLLRFGKLWLSGHKLQFQLSGPNVRGTMNSRSH